MNSTLSNIWIRFQAKSEAFPHTEEVGPLPKYHNHLVQVRDLTGVGGLVDTYRRSPGRPAAEPPGPDAGLHCQSDTRPSDQP